MPVLRTRRMMTTRMLTPIPPMTTNSNRSSSSNTHQNQQSSPPPPLPLLFLLTTLRPRAATSEIGNGRGRERRQQQQGRARVRVVQGVGSAIVPVRHPPDSWSLFSTLVDYNFQRGYRWAWSTSKGPAIGVEGREGDPTSRNGVQIRYIISLRVYPVLNGALNDKPTVGPDPFRLVSPDGSQDDLYRSPRYLSLIIMMIPF
jgi:hypothetical protein